LLKLQLYRLRTQGQQTTLPIHAILLMELSLKEAQLLA